MNTSNKPLPADLRADLVECLTACAAESTPLPEALMLHWGNGALRTDLIRTHRLNEAQVETIHRIHATLLERDPDRRRAEEKARAVRSRFQFGVFPSSERPSKR